MDKVIGMIRVLLVGIGFIVLVAMYCIIKTQESKIIQEPNYIPSAMEIQKRLKDLGEERYDPGKIDGVIGRQSQKAWDNYECDKQAKKEFNESR